MDSMKFFWAFFWALRLIYWSPKCSNGPSGIFMLNRSLSVLYAYVSVLYAI